jgi:hypothetical protein
VLIDGSGESAGRLGRALRPNGIDVATEKKAVKIVP